MNSDENGDEELESGGDMSKHMQRYKNYIDNLKQGKSSGISSVFGRASDLLPPEVMEIKQPTVHLQGLSHERKPSAPDRVDEAEDVDDDDEDGNSPDDDEDFDDETDGDVEDEDEDEDADDDSDEDEETDGDIDDDDSVDDDDDTHDDDDENEDYDDDEDDDDYIEAGEDQITVTNELAVSARNGEPLWNIFFNRAEPVLITMNDGSSIRNAEGRDESVLALKTTGNRFKFFILSGLVIDPTTGNIYAEANDGAYTVAFLNSGWQIHQYRTHDGAEVYYATEPFRKGRDRITTQIMNLKLDPATGDVSYDSADGSASMTLKSRRL
ncbi:hypothetical protein KF707_20325 [Candidatus Obscuribacterales bacterium]|nr:hypothetical protein [Candidatus Obscuribacterales bacterium]